MGLERSVFVISDLHIGGAYPDENAQHPERRRGFRMMTNVPALAQFIRHLARLPKEPHVELVINGDFIDFPAEEVGAGIEIDPQKPPAWTPFREGRGEALAAFKAAADRDAALFDALHELVAADKSLTILLGNHDLELSFPDVRQELLRRLGRGRVRFIDDGQALDLGDVLIDHGNVFDPANVVDHEKLRLVRAVYSRGWYEELGKIFTPPAGSRLVADVMNPIKIAYGFVDLLKPESEPLFAMLLALEPSYRDKLDEAAKLLFRAAKTLVPRRNLPYALRNVSDTQAVDPTIGLHDVSDGTTPPSALDELVAEVLTDHPEVIASLRSNGDGAALTPVSDGTWAARFSLFRLLIGDEEGDLDDRIPQLQATLRVLRRDQSFVDDSESKRYLDAAEWLTTHADTQKGYRAVIFGHTHHAKDIRFGDGKRYFNTGTWANLMRFPDDLTDPKSTKEQIRERLLTFATHLKNNELAQYLIFRPTYVRIDLDANDEMLAGELRDYDHQNDRL